MPPKRQRSTRNSAKKSAATESAQAESEDAKPTVEQQSPEPEPPSDPLATESEAAPSLTAPAPSSAATHSATPSNAADARNSGPSTQRGKKLLSKPKFTGRRSQSRLQEIQQVEDERKKAEAGAKAAEEAAKARREGKRRDDGHGRGRGGSTRGRGRGGYMGERERESEAVASGPFGAGQVSKESRRAKRFGISNYRPWASIRPRESVSRTTASPTAPSPAAAEDGKAVKQESGPNTAQRYIANSDEDVSMEERPRATVEDGGYISSDEDEEEKGVGRVNVEDLGVIDLTHDDPFAPVRVTRVAHKEKALGINADGATDQDGAIAINANDTTTTSEKRKGKQKAKEVEITREKKTFQATYSDSESEAQPRTTIKHDPEGDAEPIRAPSSDTLQKEPPSSPDARRKAKDKAKTGAVSNEPLPEGLDYQTRDETEERERHQKDLKVLRNELGVQNVANVDQNGDATMTDSQSKDKRAEKVYLFQFPPVLPDLIPIAVKPDPETTNSDQEGMQIDAPITIPDDDNKSKTRSEPQLPSGSVGKLKVHASGRVTLDWGGTSLCLGMGTEASFLQDILVAGLPEAKDEEGQRGTATSMGQVKGKFVVTPDWEEILR